MRKIITLSVLGVLCVTSGFAQRAIQAEWGYTLGNKNQDAHAFALSWMQSEGLLSESTIRFNYFRVKEDEAFYSSFRTDFFQLDVAKRWNSLQVKRVRFNFEAGLSAMITNTNRPFYYGGYYCDCLYCDCFLPSIIEPAYMPIDEGGLSLNYNRKNEENVATLYPGATIGSGMDVAISKDFYIGLHTRLNAYYGLGTNDILHYLRFGINTGFCF